MCAPLAVRGVEVDRGDCGGGGSRGLQLHSPWLTAGPYLAYTLPLPLLLLLLLLLLSRLRAPHAPAAPVRAALPAVRLIGAATLSHSMPETDSSDHRLRCFKSTQSEVIGASNVRGAFPQLLHGL